MIKTAKYYTKVVGANSRVRTLRRHIEGYERRYELASGKMLGMISSGKTTETADILKWMQDYHALQLLRRTTPTNGTRTIITGQSMKRD